MEQQDRRVDSGDELTQCFACPYIWLLRNPELCPACAEKRHFDLFDRAVRRERASGAKR